MKITFTGIGKIPIKETLADFLSLEAWKRNRWFHHSGCALIGSAFLTRLLNNLPKWEAIVLGSIIGWLIARVWEFYQAWTIISKNPKHIFSQKERTESAKDWIATTIFFFIFQVIFNLLF